MDTTILALKYRPQKLADLIGQEGVVETLTNAYNGNKLYQSFIFAGNFGTGKTSTARILAAMENCEEGPTLEPCGKCKQCREIFAGESSDIREVNAASSNGIEDVRNIADFVSSPPLQARVKYVILDECLDYASRINTDQGLIEIGKIVNSKKQLNVLSYNEEKCVAEWKPITGWFKNGGKDIYRLKFDHRGVLLASSNHLVSTKSGYKAVSELNVGDSVMRLARKISPQQWQMILGTTLGDNCICKNKSTCVGFWKGSRCGHRLGYVHGEKQKDYLFYKYYCLRNFVKTEPKSHLHKYDKDSNETTLYTFRTIVDGTFSSLSEIAPYVVRGNKKSKTITKELVDQLDWIAIAFWYGDDGSCNSHPTKDGVIRNCIQFHTQGFTYEENCLLQEWFKKRDIHVDIKKAKDSPY
ncbi:MAG: hypothetical protein WCO84_07975, partial [bacterium]